MNDRIRARLPEPDAASESTHHFLLTLDTDEPNALLDAVDVLRQSGFVDGASILSAVPVGAEPFRSGGYDVTVRVTVAGDDPEDMLDQRIGESRLGHYDCVMDVAPYDVPEPEADPVPAGAVPVMVMVGSAWVRFGLSTTRGGRHVVVWEMDASTFAREAR